VGDGGTSIVQVSLTGALINSMTLGLDPTKPQGTAYYDPEGLTYVGGGKFIVSKSATVSSASSRSPPAPRWPMPIRSTSSWAPPSATSASKASAGTR
jgi:hypothetical protein